MCISFLEPIISACRLNEVLVSSGSTVYTYVYTYIYIYIYIHIYTYIYIYIYIYTYIYMWTSQKGWEFSHFVSMLSTKYNVVSYHQMQ